MSSVGTLEIEWAEWPFLETLPKLSRPRGRVVVVSAHPDDEVLGAGGLLALLARNEQAAPHFVTVTDGEASHGAQQYPRGQELAARRAHELIEGLRVLGYRDPEITRLGLPDSDVAAHVDELASRLMTMVSSADLVLCPARTDGHVDHAAVGKVTTEICAGKVPVWEFPIWLWHWTKPGDPEMSWEGAGRIAIAPEAMQRKRRALECFGSQIAVLPGDDSQVVILPPEVLEHFHRPYEVFFT